MTSTTTASSATPSALALCVENIDAWRKSASEEGLSLEQYMEKMSAKNLEENLDQHMKALAAEAMNAIGDKNTKTDEVEEHGSEASKSEDESGGDTSSDAGDPSEGDSGEEHPEGEESEEDDTEGEESEGGESDVPVEEFDAKLEELVEKTNEEKKKASEVKEDPKKTVLAAAVESHKNTNSGFETANSNLEKGYFVWVVWGVPYKVSGFVLKFQCGVILPFDRLKALESFKEPTSLTHHSTFQLLRCEPQERVGPVRSPMLG